MGVLVHTECIGCSRMGNAYEDTNYIYKCYNCEINEIDWKIKRATKQVWWIELLYWLTDRKSVNYNREHIKMLAEELK
jgi:hypothetical protein